MRKNQLASALAASIVGIAGIANLSNAINVNPDGSGQALIYPYYTVEAGNDTLISVVNTANEVKAVKVRFHEHVNSREPLDFHLYLSPFDVWTATVRTNPNGDTANGFPILFTRDTSCTVPAIRNNPQLPQLPPNLGGDRYVEFSAIRLSSATLSQPADTRSGYLEMLEMGVVNTGTVAGFNPAAAATHSNGVPAGCGTLVAAWSAGGPWSGGSASHPLANNTLISAPTGGLFGGAAIINVEQGRMISYNATAIEGVAFGGNGGQHQDPSSVVPQLSTYVSTAAQTANVFVGGRLVQSTYQVPGFPAVGATNGTLALSATLALSNITNEYAFLEDGTFRSEWVVTFPTKRFHTDATVAVAQPPVPPFQTASGALGGCERVDVTVYDREEFRVPFVNFSPVILPSLCAEANVVNFERLPPGGVGTSGLPALAATPILGARNQVARTGAVLGAANAHGLGVLRVGIPAPTNAGWANLSFVTPQSGRFFPADRDGDSWVGLPQVGFWVLAAENNSAAPGIRAFYSGAFTHKGQRRCENLAGC